MFCITALPTHCQYLVVNLLSGQTEQYAVSEIRSIKFVTNSMVLTQNDGMVITWDIAHILNYEFDLSMLSSDVEFNQSNALHIYPNPSSDRVQIDYTGREHSPVLIEILDGNGKTIVLLFSGWHEEKTSVSWDIRSASIAPGTYLCRVSSSSSKVVTGKIIVQ